MECYCVFVINFSWPVTKPSIVFELFPRPLALVPPKMSVELWVALCIYVCQGNRIKRSVWFLSSFSFFFLEMLNICPIDSREACFSFPKPLRLHRRSSSAVELFILVSRISQLTHWGDLCRESPVSSCAHVCMYLHQFACACAWVRAACACVRVGFMPESIIAVKKKREWDAGINWTERMDVNLAEAT